MKKKIYILLANSDGTMRSTDEPFGAAVTTEKEAKAFAKKGNVGYTKSYQEVTVYDTWKEAVEDIYNKADSEF